MEQEKVIVRVGHEVYSILVDVEINRDEQISNACEKWSELGPQLERRL